MLTAIKSHIPGLHTPTHLAKPSPPMSPGWYTTSDPNWQRFHDGTCFTKRIRETPPMY